MYSEGTWKEEDSLVDDLTEQQIRQVPPQSNSIIWLLWHMARCEDVAINTLLRNTDEVFDRGEWASKVAIQSRHIGTGATREEMQAISNEIEFAALRAYRAEVGRETRRWVSELDFGSLSTILNAEDARRTVVKGDLSENAVWVETHWATAGWTHCDCLYWLAIEHNWYHVGEIRVIRGLVNHPDL